MDFELSDEQRSIRNLARDFAQGEVAPRAAEYDQSGEFPYPLVAEMGKLGFFMLPFPEAVGGAVCVEVNNCWMERDLTGTLGRSVGRFSVVQLSDYVEGTGRTPDRAVPGDGMIPLRRIVEDVVAAGYGGPFELEILGPRIEAEGADAAIRRGAAWVSELLDDVGVAR